MSETAIQHFSSLFETALQKGRENGEPDWRTHQRETAFSRFRDIGFPTVRQEHWKYTNVAPITSTEFVLPQPAPLPDVSSLIGEHREDEIEFIFVDGALSREHSTAKAAAGLELTLFKDAMANGEGELLKSRLESSAFGKSDAFPSLNQAFGSEGVWVKIADNAVIEKRVHILFLTTGTVPNALLAPRVIVDAGRSSQAFLVQSHIGGPGASSFTSAVTDIRVAENAKLTYCKIQSEAPDAFHYGLIRSSQMADSHVMHFDFSRGGRLARNELYAGLDGQGAEVHLNGLYAVKDKQHIDNHTTVDHRVPRCYSRQRYKGILDDSGRAVFNGAVVVQPGAVNTDGVQLNQNLLLSRDAKVNTKPQLEIQNDDVKCTHGATIGQIDEDQLFYAMSRGVNKDEAIAVLSRGFVEDVLFLLGNKPLQESLHGLLDSYFAN